MEYWVGAFSAYWTTDADPVPDWEALRAELQASVSHGAPSFAWPLRDGSIAALGFPLKLDPAGRRAPEHGLGIQVGEFIDESAKVLREVWSGVVRGTTGPYAVGPAVPVQQAIGGSVLFAIAVRAATALGSAEGGIAWLDSPNRVLAGLTPREAALRKGDAELVYALLDRREEGISS